MDITYYKNMEPLFGEWTIVRMIGEGSFGKVFEIRREDFGRTYTAAMKVISIPQSDSELRSAMSEGLDSNSVETYYRGVVNEIVDEFALMSDLKGTSNIVSYEDHKVIPRTDRFGWDILIRMELLTPLFDHIVANGMTRREIVQLGIDLCRALELCKSQKVIHRDIKPENIFISKNGHYKLGDFGIAKTVEKTNSAFSQKGTYSYMAPEVFRGESYGSSVDLYSLGLVLFRLLNHNRAPFLPLYPASMMPSDREISQQKRLSGVELPCPVNADEAMLAIIRKASAFRAEDRYASPTEMRLDLERVLEQQDRETIVCVGEMFVPVSEMPSVSKNRDVSDSNGPFVKTEPVVHKPPVAVEPPEEPEKKQKARKTSGKKKPGLWIALAAAAVVALVVGGIVFLGGGDKNKDPGAEMSDQSDTFASMLWGNYIIEDCTLNAEYSIYVTDFTNFMQSMKYEDIQDYNVSVVPYAIDVELVSEERYSEDDWEDLHQEFIGAGYKEKYWENCRKFYEMSIMRMNFCDQLGTPIYANCLYRVEGNKLFACFDYTIDDETFEVETGEWLEYTFYFKNCRLILERNGCRSEMIPKDFSKVSTSNISVDGYASDPSRTYQSIACIYAHIYKDLYTYYNIEFVDGGKAIDPLVVFNENETVTISWSGVSRYYNGRYRTFDEPGSVTTHYIYTDDYGIILVVDGEYYCYQASEEQYKDHTKAE